MRPRLLQPELGGQQGQAVTGNVGQQDPGDVEGVDDLPPAVPQAGGGQEPGVEHGAMADGLAALHELRQLAQGDFGRRAASEVGRPDPGQLEHGVGDRAAGVDQAVQCRQDSAGVEGDGSDLYDAVALGVETRRLQVERNVLHGTAPILRSAFRGGPRLPVQIRCKAGGERL